MMNANANKLRILSTVAVVLLIAAMGVYAYTTLTANTGTITVITHPPHSNIIIMGANLNWPESGGQGEDCTVSSSGIGGGGGGPYMTITCPPSGPTVYVGDNLMLSIQFGNMGNENGTLNNIGFNTTIGIPLVGPPGDGVLQLQNFEPCVKYDGGGGGCTTMSYPITIPVNGQPGTPVNMNWQINAVGPGTDAATFTFNTSG